MFIRSPASRGIRSTAPNRSLPPRHSIYRRGRARDPAPAYARFWTRALNRLGEIAATVQPVHARDGTHDPTLGGRPLGRSRRIDAGPGERWSSARPVRVERGRFEISKSRQRDRFGPSSSATEPTRRAGSCFRTARRARLCGGSGIGSGPFRPSGLALARRPQTAREPTRRSTASSPHRRAAAGDRGCSSQGYRAVLRVVSVIDKAPRRPPRRSVRTLASSPRLWPRTPEESWRIGGDGMVTEGLASFDRPLFDDHVTSRCRSRQSARHLTAPLGPTVTRRKPGAASDRSSGQ